MQRNRRKFLKMMAIGTGTSLGVGTYWISTSNRWMARVARQLMADAKRDVLSAPVTPLPAKWSDNEVTMTWIGHTTVLINFYGLRILTDPAFSNRVGIQFGLGTAGPKRHIAPALKMKDLPPIDLVLLSHAHMDHMDMPSLGRLRKAPLVVTAKSTQDILEGIPFKEVRELTWGEKTVIKNGGGDLEISAFEVKHWGERWPKKIERGYNGYILKRDGKSILFGGDTANTPHFAELKSKGPFDLAIMPIGAYQPWIRSHCNPEEALAMANVAGARYILPVHHQTFKLSEEPMNEPIERLQEALSDEPERLALKQVGETFVLPKG
jgi:L-ascorbate metabolism protein UlaG (beta-lactamase superfamily)